MPEGYDSTARLRLPTRWPTSSTLRLGNIDLSLKSSPDTPDRDSRKAASLAESALMGKAVENSASYTDLSSKMYCVYSDGEMNRLKDKSSSMVDSIWQNARASREKSVIEVAWRHTMGKSVLASDTSSLVLFVR